LAERLIGMTEADQVTELLGLIRGHASTVLGHSRPDAIDTGRSFKEIGLDSLTAVELRNRLNETTGLKLPTTVTFDHPTPAELADHLRDRLSGQEPAPSETIDFAAEAVLADDVVPTGGAAGSTSEPDHVFLTGANGFVGVFVLRELMRCTHARIHCLVRGHDEAHARQRLIAALEQYQVSEDVDLSRITVVVGDLTRSRFGLEQVVYDALAAQVDVIYHVGAQVNWTYPYAMLKASNIESTERVLRFAAAERTTAVHYLSTGGVFAANAPDGMPLPVDAPTGPPEALLNGYAQSKWVAEQLVRQAQDRGLPITIYRPTLLSGDKVHGACQTEDFLWRKIKGCIQAGAAPGVDTHFDLTPVDFLSAAVAHISLRPENTGQTFHFRNRHLISGHTMFEHLRALDYRLDDLDHKAWTTVIHAYSKNSFHTLTDIFDKALESRLLPLTLDAAGTEQALTGTTVSCPEITEDLFQTYIDFSVHAGYLPEPVASSDGRVAIVGS
jgi:thioester reductase-like protein